MTFDEILDQVLDLLKRQGRLSYRALKVRLQLADDYLEAIKDELIYARRVAVDEDNRVLVWVGEIGSASTIEPATPLALRQEREPSSYVPPHLAEKILISRSALEGERKQVTVLFCDLVNSTALAERIGPEAMYALLNHFVELSLAQLHHYEGTINQFLGDGFMALFGAPIAHEDHARRGVLAALALQRTLHEHQAELGEPHGVICQFRMGLNSGLVVVGKIGDNLRMDYSAIGDTMNLASRLQQIAQPGEILISESTCQLVKGLLWLEALPPVRVKGKAEPVTPYRAIGILPRRSPVVSQERTLSAFVGRKREMGRLEALFRRVEAGQGQVVGIVAEAGGGKSRLIYEFRQWLADQRVTYLEGRCLSYGRTIPYHPVIDIVRHNCGIRESHTPESAVDMVRLALDEVGMDTAVSAPYLLQLLGIAEGTAAIAGLSPEAIRARTFRILNQMSLRSSQRRPLVIEIEDLHWVDQTSEAYLASLVASLPGAPIMLLTTYRPGYRPPWLAQPHVTQLALRHLVSQHALTVVRSVVQQARLPELLLRTILAKAEGNPFFLEELTRAALEHGSLHDDMTVPDTIQGVIMARVDRLPEAPRRLLQTASVLGREFSPQLLEAIWEGPGSPEPLFAELKRLAFLYERSDAEGVSYVFKHALTQEVSYESLLTTRRQALHAAAGRALERLYAERLDEASDRLAYHFARTDDVVKAVEYLARLARRATRGAAHAEALRTLQEALEHAQRLPDADRDARVIDLVMRQARCLTVLGHLTDARDLLLREQDRLARLQDRTVFGFYYFLLGNAYSFLGDHSAAIQSAQQALEAATTSADAITVSRVYYLLAFEAFWTGQYQQGIAHSQHAITLLEHHEERSGLVYWIMGITLGHLGAFDEALQTLDRAQTIGETLDDPHLQGIAWHNKGMVYAWRGESKDSIAACQRGLALSLDPLGKAVALGAFGMAYVEQDDAVQALPLLEQSLQELRQIQHWTFQGWVAAFLSEAYRLHGQLEPARTVARQELARARDLDNAFVMGMMQRTLGRVAHALGQQAEAITHLYDALQTFHSIQARFESGRTHLDLASLTHALGQQAEAVSHLRAANDLFAELRVFRYDQRMGQLAREWDVPLARPH